MPLGPIPTDAAIGEDHVAAAIGATLFGLQGCGNILAAVTREEHTGGIPSVKSTLEAVRASRVAAHIIDLALLEDVATDSRIAGERANSRTCVVGKRSRGCSRCGKACPL
jgi:phosphomethylpyrimidine synthase